VDEDETEESPPDDQIEPPQPLKQRAAAARVANPAFRATSRDPVMMIPKLSKAAPALASFVKLHPKWGEPGANATLALRFPANFRKVIRFDLGATFFAGAAST
jgi:hypothetical protein